VFNWWKFVWKKKWKTRIAINYPRIFHKLMFLIIYVQLMEIRVKNEIGKRFFRNFVASN